MERLTDKKSGNPICSEQGGLGVSAKFIRRLAEYENTELAPDEISILKGENVKLKQQLNEAMELLELSIANIKECADDNGGCYGCKNLDIATDKCKSLKGRLLCDVKKNNMWKWQHADRYEKLKGDIENDI